MFSKVEILMSQFVTSKPKSQAKKDVVVAGMQSACLMNKALCRSSMI
jgi:hypothetical protein